MSKSKEAVAVFSATMFGLMASATEVEAGKISERDRCIANYAIIALKSPKVKEELGDARAQRFSKMISRALLAGGSALDRAESKIRSNLKLSEISTAISIEAAAKRKCAGKAR